MPESLRFELGTLNRRRVADLPLLGTFLAMGLRCWIPIPSVPCSKSLGGSKLETAFHPSEDDKMSTRNFWEPSGKK